MTKKQGWTRRQFSQAAALVAAGSLLPVSARAHAEAPLSGLAFLGSAPTNGEAGAIHVYRVSGSDWRHVQSVPAPAPGRLLLHPTLPMLYALHDVAVWEHLPRGAVSTYAIDSQRGVLTLGETQPLSLAATHPRHATLTADGSHLFVSAERGGMYNLLPLSAKGNLLAVSAIRKEFGSEYGEVEKVAAPGAVALHPDGSLLAVDSGQESLTRFRLDGGLLTVQQRVRVHAGHGSKQLALSPCGKRAYALHVSGLAISTHGVGDGSSLRTLSNFLSTSRAEMLTATPDGRFLLAAGAESTDVLRIAPDTGALSFHAQLRDVGQRISFAAGADQLFGFDRNGEVRQTAFDTVHGAAACPEIVARVQDCVSLLFCPAGHAATRMGFL